MLGILRQRYSRGSTKTLGQHKNDNPTGNTGGNLQSSRWNASWYTNRAAASRIFALLSHMYDAMFEPSFSSRRSCLGKGTQADVTSSTQVDVLGHRRWDIAAHPSAQRKLKKRAC